MLAAHQQSSRLQGDRRAGRGGALSQTSGLVAGRELQQQHSRKLVVNDSANCLGRPHAMLRGPLILVAGPGWPPDASSTLEHPAGQGPSLQTLSVPAASMQGTPQAARHPAISTS